MKYVFHNYPRQLISVCFLLNPEIPIFLLCKHFPSRLINLSYVNEAGGAQLLFFWMLSKALFSEKQLTRAPAKMILSFAWKAGEDVKQRKLCTLHQSRSGRGQWKLISTRGGNAPHGPAMAVSLVQSSTFYLPTRKKAISVKSLSWNKTKSLIEHRHSDGPFDVSEVSSPFIREQWTSCYMWVCPLSRSRFSAGFLTRMKAEGKYRKSDTSF